MSRRRASALRSGKMRLRRSLTIAAPARVIRELAPNQLDSPGGHWLTLGQPAIRKKADTDRPWHNGGFGWAFSDCAERLGGAYPA